MPKALEVMVLFIIGIGALYFLCIALFIVVLAFTATTPQEDEAEARRVMREIIDAQSLHRAAHGVYAPTLDTLVQTNPGIADGKGRIRIPFYDLEHSANESTFKIDAIPRMQDKSPGPALRFDTEGEIIEVPYPPPPPDP